MCLHPMPQNKLKECLHRWQGISANAAARVLVSRGYGHDTMYWKQVEKSPRDIMKSPRLDRVLARDVGDFKFVGGPPGKKCILQGTLLMLLVDRIMFDGAKDSEARTQTGSPIGC